MHRFIVEQTDDGAWHVRDRETPEFDVEFCDEAEAVAEARRCNEAQQG